MANSAEGSMSASVAPPLSGRTRSKQNPVVAAHR